MKTVKLTATILLPPDIAAHLPEQFLGWCLRRGYDLQEVNVKETEETE